MRKFFSFFIIYSLIFLSVSCGKKGSLLPPIIKLPQKIKTFRAYQRGKKIILEWANPETYTDGSPLSGISKVEIWLMEIEVSSGKKSKQPSQSEANLSITPPTKESSEEKVVSLKRFEKEAKLIEALKEEELTKYQFKSKAKFPRFQYEFPLTGNVFLSMKFIFGLKVRDNKNKESDFSEFITVEPKALPLPPQDLKYSVYEDKIEISWTPPEKNIDESSPPEIKGYNVYRYENNQEPQCLNSKVVEDSKYEDEDFIFGKTYYYFVRASVSDSSSSGESANSEIIEVVAQDKFPPASPSGLMSMAGQGYITLSWDENKEKDFAGYRVWRRKEGQEEFILLTQEPIKANNFTDTEVEKNSRYYYAITAQDIFGNESPKSDIVSDILREGLS